MAPTAPGDPRTAWEDPRALRAKPGEMRSASELQAEGAADRSRQRRRCGSIWRGAKLRAREAPRMAPGVLPPWPAREAQRRQGSGDPLPLGSEAPPPQLEEDQPRELPGDPTRVWRVPQVRRAARAVGLPRGAQLLRSASRSHRRKGRRREPVEAVRVWEQQVLAPCCPSRPWSTSSPAWGEPVALQALPEDRNPSRHRQPLASEELGVVAVRAVEVAIGERPRWAGRGPRGHPWRLSPSPREQRPWDQRGLAGEPLLHRACAPRSWRRTWGTAS